MSSASTPAPFRRIGVVAPSCPIAPEIAERVRALAAARYPARLPEIVFHPQCFLSEGHFAGPDAARARAFLDVADDPGFDAVWFARGGYGAGRIVEAVLPRLGAAARAKAYLGYSDAGVLLAALYAAGFGEVAHGPMPQDALRPGGEAAVGRALAWLVDRDPTTLEPSVAAAAKTAAFNLTILASLLGTPWAPDLRGHVVMLEEVAEPLYRIDRALFQVTSNPGLRQAAGVRLGRCDPITPNTPDFALDEEASARLWCERAGIAWLGRADIGHDAGNKVVPFGGLRRA